MEGDAIEAWGLFQSVLRQAVELSASDVHFVASEPLALRVDGEIRFSESRVFSREETEAIILRMLPGESEKIQLEEERECDFTYESEDGVSFRCNAFHKRGELSVSMRRISQEIPSLLQLGAPEKLSELALERQGLILFCGPTGHGKTTTAYALLDEMNRRRSDHIITIEDPIEYHLESRLSVVSQREVPHDTKSFPQSIRAAMRQDPDILMVGEMRDPETVNAVFQLCATGHLVVSTIHANSASQSMYRITQTFPEAQREWALHQLADALLAGVNQRLVPAVGGGRVALYEFMYANYAVKNAIRNGDIAQLDNTIDMSAGEGMISMRRAAEKLVAEGKVSFDVVEPYLTR